MLRFISICSIIFIFIFSELISQSPGYNVPARKKKDEKEKRIFEPDFEFLFSFSYHNSSGYFDKNGKLITDLPDTISFPGIPRRFTFDLKRYTFNLDFKYFATKDLSFMLSTPMTIYKLDEIFTEYYDAENQAKYLRGYKDQLSHTRIDFIGLSANYSLFDSSFINRYTAEFRLPTGGVDGVQNDQREFWSDGALEFTPGFVVGLKSDKATIELGGKYNYRAEDMTDRAVLNINGALHTVPGTLFYVYYEGYFNIEKVKEDVEFNIRKMPFQDEYQDVGVGFKFFVEEQYIGDFSYRIRLDGKNAWNHAAYFINFGYRF